MKKEPTKADLAAAVAKLTKENAGMRDLLAAISEYARSVPQASYDHVREELRRATSVLISISVVTDPDGTWTWSWEGGQGAAHLRERAAEPVGYEVYVKPEADELHAEPAPKPVYRLACGCLNDYCECPRCADGTPHETGHVWHCDEHGATSIAGLAQDEAPALKGIERLAALITGTAA